MIVVFSNKGIEWGIGCDKVKIDVDNQKITMVNQYEEIVENLRYVKEIVD